MERYVWVKQARARFADILNTAAYGSDRVVILRRGEELGAVIGKSELDYMRRHKPHSRYPEPPALEMPPDPGEIDLLWRENKLCCLERTYERYGASERQLKELAEDREHLKRLRAYYGPPKNSPS